MKNMLRSLFLWFYCLDLPAAVLLVLAVTMFFLLLHSWLAEKDWWIRMVGVMLICWVFVIVCATVLVRNSGDVFPHSFAPLHSYREAHLTGNIELYRSNFMNMVLFYPAGLLAAAMLPRRWPGWSRCLLVVLLLAAVSAGIEFLQYRYSLGRCEIDDVIHNTAGVLLGSLAAMCSYRCETTS